MQLSGSPSAIPFWWTEGLLLPQLVPVLHQINPRDDVDDFVLVHDQYSGVPREKQTISFVEMNRDVELGQGLGHDFADGYFRGIGVIVEDAGQSDFLNAADRFAVLQDR